MSTCIPHYQSEYHNNWCLATQATTALTVMIFIYCDEENRSLPVRVKDTSQRIATSNHSDLTSSMSLKTNFVDMNQSVVVGIARPPKPYYKHENGVRPADDDYGISVQYILEHDCAINFFHAANIWNIIIRRNPVTQMCEYEWDNHFIL